MDLSELCAKIGALRDSSRGCGGDNSTSLTTRLQTAINGILGFLRENRRILGNSWANKGILVRFGATIDQKRDKTVYKGTKRPKTETNKGRRMGKTKTVDPDSGDNRADKGHRMRKNEAAQWKFLLRRLAAHCALAACAARGSSNPRCLLRVRHASCTPISGVGVGGGVGVRCCRGVRG